MKKIIDAWDRTSFHLNRLVYYAGFTAAALFMLSFFIEPLFTIAVILLICTGISVFVDFLLLYQRRGLDATRNINDRLSNGDENKVLIEITNEYDFKINCSVIDELPFQFQERNWKREMTIGRNETETLEYSVKPLERGEYN